MLENRWGRPGIALLITKRLGNFFPSLLFVRASPVCKQKTPENDFWCFYKQGYQDSNLEMTESESVALPFGDSPSTDIDYT